MRKKFVPQKLRFNPDAWRLYGFATPEDVAMFLVSKGFSLIRAIKVVYGAGSLSDFMYLVELLNADISKFFEIRDR